MKVVGAVRESLVSSRRVNVLAGELAEAIPPMPR
jgi:hypothetical protein